MKGQERKRHFVLLAARWSLLHFSSALKIPLNVVIRCTVLKIEGISIKVDPVQFNIKPMSASYEFALQLLQCSVLNEIWELHHRFGGVAVFTYDHTAAV